MPSHSDEETAIVAKVGGPVILGVGHEGSEILLEGLVVEGLEGGNIVKLLAQRVGDSSVLAKDVELDRLWPPVAVSGAATGDGEVWALALGHCDGV